MMNQERIQTKKENSAFIKSINNIKNSDLGQNAIVSGCLSLNTILEQVFVLLQGLPWTSCTVGKGKMRFR